jgi:hypothetical protein
MDLSLGPLSLRPNHPKVVDGNEARSSRKVGSLLFSITCLGPHLHLCRGPAQWNFLSAGASHSPASGI